MTSGFLEMKQLTNGDQWKEGHAMIQTHISDKICMFRSVFFPPNFIASVKGVSPRCARQLYSPE
jgi:hypothetical protein